MNNINGTRSTSTNHIMHVVIIGGGLAGMSVLTTLGKVGKKTHPDLKITVIDPKSYVEVRWAAIRAMFDKSMNESIIAPYSKIMKPYEEFVTHVIGRVETVDPTTYTVILDSGEQLTYDVCLVTFGSVTKQPILMPQLSTNASSQNESESVNGRMKDLLEFGDKLVCDKHVLVVGGGMIGCELAGDIAGYAQRKGNTECKVTLVQSGSELIPGYGPKASRLTKEQLENLGVDIKLNTRAYDTYAENKYELRSTTNADDSELLQATSVFFASGVKPPNRDIFKQFDDGMTDNTGWLLPDDFGRLPNCNGRIFALGDCVKGEPKSGVTAMGQKQNMANNILKTLTAISDNQGTSDVQDLVKTKIEGFIAGLVTTGPDSGVAAMPFGTTTWFIPRLKNKTMFIFKARQEVGW